MASNLDLLQIQRKGNQFCWLFLACLLIGCFKIAFVCVALEYAKNEKADTTSREVRFNLIGIQSPQYHFWRILATVFNISGVLLTPLMLVACFRYLRSQGVFMEAFDTVFICYGCTDD
jgi:hypothetical protein